MPDRTKKSVLVVAFDGLDKELIERFACSNLLEMKEYGSIDNSTKVKTIGTGELFISFQTEVTSQQHGINRIKKFSNPHIDALEYKLIKKLPYSHKTHTCTLKSS